MTTYYILDKFGKIIDKKTSIHFGLHNLWRIANIDGFLTDCYPATIHKMKLIIWRSIHYEITRDLGFTVKQKVIY